MKHFSKKEKLLFLSALLAVGGVVGTNLNFFEGRKSVSTNNQRKLLLKKKIIAQSLELLEHKEEINKAYENFRHYIAEERTAEEEFADFIKEIEVISEESSVQFADLKQSEPERHDEFVEYKVEVETVTDIEILMSFMYKLHSSESLLRVVQFRISPSADKVNAFKAYMTISKMFLY